MSISIAHPVVLARSPRMLGGMWAGPPSAIRRAILLAFLCMGSIIGCLGAYAVSSIAAIGQSSDQAIDGALTSIGYARAASADFVALEAATARHVARPNQGELAERIAHSSAVLDEDLAVVAQRASTPQATQAAVDAAAAIVGWRAAAGLTFAGAAVDSGRMDEPSRNALSQLVHRRMERLVNHAVVDGLQFQERVRATMTEAGSRALLFTGAAMMLSGVIATLLAGAVVRSVAGASIVVTQRVQACTIEVIEHSGDDAVERGRNEATISHMARHDGLTGLPNRAALRESVDRAVHTGGPGRHGGVGRPRFSQRQLEV